MFYNDEWIMPILQNSPNFVPPQSNVVINSNQLPLEPTNLLIQSSDIQKLNSVEYYDEWKTTAIKTETPNYKYSDWSEINVKEDLDLIEETVKKEIEENYSEWDWNKINVKEEPEPIKHENIAQSPQIINQNEESSTCESNNEETESKIKSFKCNHCTYTTNWRGNLTKHVISRHTALEEIKWFECAHCTYKGKTRDYLKWHLINVHDISVKWYNCTKCSFKAKLKSLLDKHVIVNHTESEKIKWFQCEHCPYKGKFKTNLKQHILSKHTESDDIQWFECEYCDFKAKRRRNLKFHQINKHTDADQIKWFHCEFCHHKVKRKTLLKQHIYVFHSEEGKQSRKRQRTREIPVFIGNKLCWKRVVVSGNSLEDYSFKCGQCSFKTLDKDLFTKHVLKQHTVTEIEQQNEDLIKTTYKTKDVVVMVDDVTYVKKIIDHPLY